MKLFTKHSLFFRGYIEAVREIEEQLQDVKDEVVFDDIVVACGRYCPASLFLNFNSYTLLIEEVAFRIYFQL